MSAPADPSPTDDGPSSLGGRVTSSPPGQARATHGGRGRSAMGADRLWLPAVASGVLAVVFVIALLVHAGGDPSLLVHAGPPCTSEGAAAAAPDCSDSASVDLAARPTTAGIGRPNDVGSPDRSGAPGSLTVQEADAAFDGQFFYRLGVAPWSGADRVAGVQFDLPALRNARWGYGALAYVASGGDPDLVPWALIGLNIAASVLVGAIGGGLARSSGRHPAWGLLFALWPGFAYSLSLDTSELVASAFLLAGLLALRHRRWAVAALALTAAVLTRDTTAVVPFGVVLAGLWAWWQAKGAEPTASAGHLDQRARGIQPADAPDRRGPSETVDRPPGTAIGRSKIPRRRRSAVGSTVGTRPVAGAGAVAVGLVALLVFAGWQLVQWSRFGAWPLTSSGDNNLNVPLAGLISELVDDLPPGSGEEAFRLLCIAGLLALVAAAAWCRRRSTAPLTERIAWVLAVAVVAVLNAYLWSGATAFARASTEAGLLSILVVLGCPSRPTHRGRTGLLPLLAAGLGGFWLLTAAVQVAKLG